MKILVLLLLVFLVAGAVYALNDSKKRPASGATHTLSDSDKAALLAVAAQAHAQQDYAALLEKLRPLADTGDAAAQYALFLCIHHGGNGVAQDNTQALAWLQKAAAQGFPEAQYNLGVFYEKGHGIPQDDDRARAWYEKAAAQGNATAQYNLGNFYNDGRGVPQDFAKAREWYEYSVRLPCCPGTSEMS